MTVKVIKASYSFTEQPHNFPFYLIQSCNLMATGIKLELLKGLIT